MARIPTIPTISTRKPSVLTLLKRGCVNAFYDAHPVAAWLVAVAMAGVMVAVLCAMPGEW